ncbi:MAG: hypothetical protein WEA99_09075 [Brumimicrobium sp.]
MKKLLLVTLTFCLTQFGIGQKIEGYNHKYQISFDAAQFVDVDVKKTVRDLREHIFEQSGQKFNMQTRFDRKGTIELNTQLRIQESYVESFFKTLKSDLISFIETDLNNDLTIVRSDFSKHNPEE